MPLAASTRSAVKGSLATASGVGLGEGDVVLCGGGGGVGASGLDRHEATISETNTDAQPALDMARP
jgi:hypothetical protein